jgi:hypothetical protein
MLTTAIFIALAALLLVIFVESPEVGDDRTGSAQRHTAAARGRSKPIYSPSAA